MASLFVQFVPTLLVRVVAVVISLGATVLVARAYGPDGAGMLTLLLVVPALVVNVGKLGSDLGLTREISRRAASDGPPVTRAALAGAGALAGLAALVSTGLLCLVISEPHLAALLDLGGVAGMRATLLCLVVLQTLVVFAQALLLGSGRVPSYNATVLVRPLCLSAWLVAGIWAAAAPGAAVAVGALTSQAATAVAGVALVLAQRPPAGRGWLDLCLVRGALALGLKGILGDVASSLAYRIDVLLIGGVLGLGAVGVYGVASNIAEAVWYIPSTLALLLLPAMGRVGPGQAAQTASRAARITLAVSAALGLSLAAVAPVAVALLYGPQFQAAVVPLRILLIGTVAVAGSKVLSSYMLAQGRSELGTVVAGSALAVNVGLNLCLIPALGVVGAAWASAVAYSLALGLWLLFFRRCSGLPARDALVVRWQELRAVRRLACGSWARWEGSGANGAASGRSAGR